MGNKVEPTEEQKYILEATGNVVVTARPGSGKTFTIVQMINRALENCYDYQGVIAISFTKKASRELDLRCQLSGIKKKSSFFGTIDHFYITEIIIPFSKHIFGKNLNLQIESSLVEFPKYEGLQKIKREIDEETERLLLQSLQDGHVFLEYTGETAYYILQKVKAAKEYISARYTHVYIDEYQDCGEIQHKIFMCLVEMGLVGVAVGDLDQAIYAFTDRYSKYLELLLKDKRFKQFRLSKNHRCHSSIVDYSLQLLGINQTIPSDMRIIKVTSCGNEISLAKRIAERVDRIKDKYSVKDNCNIAILCRNNGSAELISKSLGIKNKLFVDNKLDLSHHQWARFFADILRDYYDTNVYPVDIASRYVDEEIENILFKKVHKCIDELFATPYDELKNKIALFKKVATLIMPEFKSNEAVVELKSVLENNDEMEGYRPPDLDEICIMTLHKSKGLEFEIVFHMDLYDWTFPRRNISEDDLKQTLNLHYVGITRAKQVCYIMQGTKRYRPFNDDFIDASESPFLYLNDVQKYRKNITWDKM